MANKSNFKRDIISQNQDNIEIFSRFFDALHSVDDNEIELVIKTHFLDEEKSVLDKDDVECYMEGIAETELEENPNCKLDMQRVKDLSIAIMNFEETTGFNINDYDMDDEDDEIMNQFVTYFEDIKKYDSKDFFNDPYIKAVNIEPKDFKKVKRVYTDEMVDSLIKNMHESMVEDALENIYNDEVAYDEDLDFQSLSELLDICDMDIETLEKIEGLTPGDAIEIPIKDKDVRNVIDWLMENIGNTDSFDSEKQCLRFICQDVDEDEDEDFDFYDIDDIENIEDTFISDNFKRDNDEMRVNITLKKLVELCGYENVKGLDDMKTGDKIKIPVNDDNKDRVINFLKNELGQEVDLTAIKGGNIEIEVNCLRNSSEEEMLSEFREFLDDIIDCVNPETKEEIVNRLCTIDFMRYAHSSKSEEEFKHRIMRSIVEEYKDIVDEYDDIDDYDDDFDENSFFTPRVGGETVEKYINLSSDEKKELWVENIKEYMDIDGEFDELDEEEMEAFEDEIKNTATKIVSEERRLIENSRDYFTSLHRFGNTLSMGKVKYSDLEIIKVGEPIKNKVRYTADLNIGYLEGDVEGIDFYRTEFDKDLDGEYMYKLASISPSEFAILKHYISMMNKDVVVFGLGAGYFAFSTALKSNVKSVVVVEDNLDTIEFFNINILPQLKAKYKDAVDKITIIHRDFKEAFTDKDFMNKFDTGFTDIFRREGTGASEELPVDKFIEYLELDKFNKLDMHYMGENKLYYVFRIALIRYIGYTGNIITDEEEEMYLNDIDTDPFHRKIDTYFKRNNVFFTGPESMYSFLMDAEIHKKILSIIDNKEPRLKIVK
jgi:hypothetical protein